MMQHTTVQALGRAHLAELHRQAQRDALARAARQARRGARARTTGTGARAWRCSPPGCSDRTPRPPPWPQGSRPPCGGSARRLKACHDCWWVFYDQTRNSSRRCAA
jgi:hypothetical protein